MRGKDTVFVPFFGHTASTITATHQLARMTGCAVIPYFHRREGGKYFLKIGAPLENFPSEDVEADTTRVNQAIEAMVREAPDHWMWQPVPARADIDRTAGRLHARGSRQPWLALGRIDANQDGQLPVVLHIIHARADPTADVLQSRQLVHHRRRIIQAADERPQVGHHRIHMARGHPVGGGEAAAAATAWCSGGAAPTG
ncbi:hypothetical protein G6F24_014839 [Rhizopus arrhizus]|nr:hypothetical protein G6F24_014839 [Rhizopus arrhizus]